MCSVQDAFTKLMFMEAVTEEPKSSNFVRSGECVLKLLFLAQNIY